MSVNFKELQEYPTTIHNFSYDIDAMINNIYVGPQGELLEQIDDFNTQYDINIGVTKNFTLKPGGYNQIKEAYGKWVLRWDMKPSGISSIFRRIREYGWRFNSFRDAAVNLETTMANLRSSGLQWQNNATEFGVELEKIKAIIINSLKKCKELYPNVTIEAKMIPMPVNRGRVRYSQYDGRRAIPELNLLEDLTTSIDYCVVFVLHIKSPTMTVHILRSDETVMQVETKCGDMLVASGASLLQMVSRNWGRTELQHNTVPTRNSHYYLEAMYLDSMRSGKHPYISKTNDAYTYELDGTEAFCSNICTGNMYSEFKDTIVNSQIEAHITYLVTWLTNYYIPQTNPLNRIKLLKGPGQDEQFSTLVNSGYNAFSVISGPEECNFGNKLGDAIPTYASRMITSMYSTVSSIEYGTDEYNDRLLEYIQRIDTDDFPCNTCTYNMDCKHQTNIMLLFKLEALEPMEEAYIGMFLELWELDVNMHGRKAIVFVEQLVYDAFRWKVDEEYDKFIQCNYISKLFCQNSDDTSVAIHYDIMSELWRKNDHTIRELHKIYSMNSGCTWDLDRLCEFNLSGSKLVVPEHDSVTEDALEELAAAVLTPEELTLRWASRNGGANNL